MIMSIEKAKETKDRLMGTPEAMMLKWKRFNKCNAYTARYNDQYDLIRSYTTIVGIVDKSNRMMYELGKWSKTTTKQMTLIHRNLYGYCEFARV